MGGHKPSTSKARHEIRQIARIGWPIIISQLAQVSMAVVDSIMAGRYASMDLAGVALATSLYVPIYVSLAGLLVANTTLLAHAVGANQQDKARHTAQQAVWLALLIAPVLMLVMFNAEILLGWFAAEPGVVAIADRYLNLLAPSIPAMAVYLCLRGIAESHSFTRPVMIISLAAAVLNIPLNLVTIYGGLGIPAMGGAGCGLSTAILVCLQAIALALTVYAHPRFGKLKLFSGWERPRATDMLSILKLGGPIGLTNLSETTLFSAITLMLAPLGATVIAANQVAMNFTALLFMIPFSISVATTVRVGQHLGAGSPKGARFAALQALKLCLVFPLINLTILLLSAPYIAGAYTDNQAVISLATQLLVMAAFFQFSDALQAFSLGALRGYKDTRRPFWITLFAYWGVAVPLGYFLTYGGAEVSALGARGMWVGLIVGLSLAAVLLLRRLAMTSQRALQA